MALNPVAPESELTKNLGTPAAVAGRDPEVEMIKFPPPVSRETLHRVGEDTWYNVGFYFVAALNTASTLGYPALIMAYLGWIAGPICMIGGGFISLYNNCLLASLHETGGKRHVRYRDLAGHIYGPYMYRVTWFVQYLNLFIGNIGSIILAGESLKAIVNAFSDQTTVKLSGWIAVAGVLILLFALAVPTLHALRFFSVFSLLMSCTYTFVAIGISLTDGLHGDGSKDYSLLGTQADKAWNAIGALATISYAFNTGIIPEIQAAVRQPSTTNMYKALALQFTAGCIPMTMLTFVGYWAYGNTVAPYMLNSLSGPSAAVTVANFAAVLQGIVCLLIYASPIYEFMDTLFGRKGDHEWSNHSMLVRLVTRTAYISISTFFGALLPFFGDFITITGALMIFPLEAAMVHHMYIKVKSKGFGKWRLAWHWSLVVIPSVLAVVTFAAGIEYVIRDATNYHAFANI